MLMKTSFHAQVAGQQPLFYLVYSKFDKSLRSRQGFVFTLYYYYLDKQEQQTLIIFCDVRVLYQNI